MKNTDFEKTINHNLTKTLQLDNITDNSKKKHIRLAVALSGGSDSLALLVAMCSIRARENIVAIGYNKSSKALRAFKVQSSKG